MESWDFEQKAGAMGTPWFSSSALPGMKTLMMAFNFIFWVSGALMLAVGIWTKVSIYKYLVLSSIYQPEAPYVMIGVGAFVILLACLGCCCSIRTSALPLFAYAGFLFVVFIFELSSGVALLMYSGKIDTGFKEGLTNALVKYGREGEKEITLALADLQEKFMCCGVDDYTDWFGTPFSRKKKAPSVPGSCCIVNVKRCRRIGLRRRKSDTQDIFSQGCHRLLVDFINRNLNEVGGIAVGFSLLQVLGAVLAFCIAKITEREMLG